MSITPSREVWCHQQEALPAGQTDSFDGVVAVVNLVSGFKHDPEPPAAEALHRLKISQVPGENTLVGCHRVKKTHTHTHTCVSVITFMLNNQSPLVIIEAH